MRSLGCEWEWQNNGDLVIWYTMPAFLTHPVTGEDIWFNQASSNHFTYYKFHPMVSTTVVL